MREIDFQHLINNYKSIDSNVDELSVFNERGILSRIRERLQWIELTDDEKQEKRKNIFTIIKKTGNPDAFALETTVIELYDISTKILDALKSTEKDSYLLRLEAMLQVFRFHINENRDVRIMNTESFPLLSNILNDFAHHRSHLITDSLAGILMFRSLLEKLKELLLQK